MANADGDFLLSRRSIASPFIITITITITISAMMMISNLGFDDIVDIFIISFYFVFYLFFLNLYSGTREGGRRVFGTPSQFPQFRLFLFGKRLVHPRRILDQLECTFALDCALDIAVAIAAIIATVVATTTATASSVAVARSFRLPHVHQTTCIIVVL